MKQAILTIAAILIASCTTTKTDVNNPRIYRLGRRAAFAYLATHGINDEVDRTAHLAYIAVKAATDQDLTPADIIYDSDLTPVQQQIVANLTEIILTRLNNALPDYQYSPSTINDLRRGIDDALNDWSKQ